MDATPRASWLNQRVQLHPGTDAWMQGDRFGLVVKIGRKYLHVKMDRSGRTLKVTPESVTMAGEW